MTTSISLLLLGCENWALTKKLLQKLELFHLTCIRIIMKIISSDVVKENKDVLNRFNSKYIANDIPRRN